MAVGKEGRLRHPSIQAVVIGSADLSIRAAQQAARFEKCVEGHEFPLVVCAAQVGASAYTPGCHIALARLASPQTSRNRSTSSSVVAHE